MMNLIRQIGDRIAQAWRWTGTARTSVRVSITVYALAGFAFYTLRENQEAAAAEAAVEACETRVQTRDDLRAVLTTNRNVLVGIVGLFGPREDPELEPVYVQIDTYDDLLANAYPSITLAECLNPPEEP